MKIFDFVKPLITCLCSFIGTTLIINAFSDIGTAMLVVAGIFLISLSLVIGSRK